ncbi:coiled-coil domain-containing protein [Sinorhizobium chiapasense]|uniref:Chromosome segregation ATPase n=1 Tax=Sinorhizobium chiapasense TaxID=501572 RepID=A0ABZ2B7W8_9HYPH
MIEYALLFALGFLTAVVIGLMIAPAIQRRIVRFAEDRLKATMPLSPQEVRAQRDAARATYAAENAKAQQALRRERDKTVTLMLQNENTLREARRLAGENADLQAQLADMNVEAADMRSTVRQLEQRIEHMKSTFETSEKDNGAKSDTIRTLNGQMDKHAADIDNLRIDLAARETEIEHLKSRVAALHDERQALRGDLKAENARARELELRLSRDESRIRQLEAAVAREAATNAEREKALTRRAEEIEKLKARVRELNQEMREATKALHAAGLATPRKATAAGTVNSKGAEPPAKAMQEPDTTMLSEDLRNRATALSERLINTKSAAHDEALRQEIADIAAGMIALTAAGEGKASPIRGLLAGEETGRAPTRKSLASRAKDILPPE